MASAAPQRGLLGRMLLRKTVAQVQKETETSELKRSLGSWNLVFLGIGCIIGAGIFVRTGNAAALHAGPAVLIGYAIAGFVRAVGHVAREAGMVAQGYRLLANTGKRAGQEVAHLHVHIFGGEPLGPMLSR